MLFGISSKIKLTLNKYIKLTLQSIVPNKFYDAIKLLNSPSF